MWIVLAGRREIFTFQAKELGLALGGARLGIAKVVEVHKAAGLGI